MAGKIIFVTKSTVLKASSRVRVYRIAERLARSGYMTETHALVGEPLWEISWRRVKDFKKYLLLFLRLSKSDRLYLHKTIFSVDFIILVLFFRMVSGMKYVFDFDDAIFLHSPIKTKLLTKYAAHVVVGSHYLLEYAKRYNARVTLLPSSIDTELFMPAEHPVVVDPPVIGWGGSSGHYENLCAFKPVLEALDQRGITYQMQFVVTGDDKRIWELFHSFPHVEVHAGVPFEDWPGLIQHFSVGVMPLLDNEFARGKCSMKLLEYMACGISAVGSRVGENRHVIREGENGFLASTTEEWVETLARLLNDSQLRERVGREGRKTVEEAYSYKAYIKKLKQVLELR